jgi:hypothetical protein
MFDSLLQWFVDGTSVQGKSQSVTRFLLLKCRPVGARLAGEGVLKIAFAGKPGSYRG